MTQHVNAQPSDNAHLLFFKGGCIAAHALVERIGILIGDVVLCALGVGLGAIGTTFSVLTCGRTCLSEESLGPESLMTTLIELTGTIFQDTIRIMTPRALFPPTFVRHNTFHPTLTKRLATSALHYTNQKTWTERHIFSRLICIGKYGVSVTFRLYDIVLGVIASIGTLLTLGKRLDYNTKAKQGCHALGGIVADTVALIVDVIQPKARLSLWIEQEP